MEGEREKGEERDEKRIMMCYVHELIPHEERNYYVLHSHSNKI